jgi:hypothetical protein
MTRLAEIMRLLDAPCPFCVDTATGLTCTGWCSRLNKGALIAEAREIREKRDSNFQEFMEGLGA